jgi:hypothetical protein
MRKVLERLLQPGQHVVEGFGQLSQFDRDGIHGQTLVETLGADFRRSSLHLAKWRQASTGSKPTE